MTSPKPDPTAERIAAALLAVFFFLFGWYTLMQGGITLRGKSGLTSFVGGYLGLAVAGFTFLVATLGVALLLRSLDSGRRTYWIGSSIVLLPPLVFALLQR